MNNPALFNCRIQLKEPGSFIFLILKLYALHTIKRARLFINAPTIPPRGPQEDIKMAINILAFSPTQEWGVSGVSGVLGVSGVTS